MPSLLGTYVAANYGRMTSIDTYGGLTYNNFGTRNLAFLKITVVNTSSTTILDFTAAAGPDTDASNISGYANQISTFDPAVSQTSATKSYLDSNSYFSVAVRTIQQFAEVYMVGTPYTSGSGTSTVSAFLVAVAIDTASDSGTGYTVGSKTAPSASNTEVIAYPTLGTASATGTTNSFGNLQYQLAIATATTATANSAAGVASVTAQPAAITVTQVFPIGNGLVAVGGSAAAS